MQGGEIFRFIVRRGPQPNQVFDLNKDVVTLGRDITNDIVINDREVSRHHLRVVRSAEGCTLEDLGSTNGTFVNGKRVSGMVALKNGDMIGLGETVTLGYEVVRPSVPASDAPYQPPTPAAPSYQPPAPAAPSYQPPTPAAPSYQPPTPAAPSYQPPTPAAPSYQPPTPAAPSYQPPAPAAPVGYGQQPDPYQVGYGTPAPQDPYYAPQAAYVAPPPPGQDYDPYQMREAGGSDTMRLVLFGCLGLMAVCCCVTIIAVVVVDQLNLYCQIPVVNSVLRSLGLITCAVGG